MSVYEELGTLLIILVKSLLCGLGISGVAFGVFFFRGLESSQGPLLAFIVGPAAFSLASLLGLLVQVPRVLKLRRWAQLIYLVIVVLIGWPSWRVAIFFN